MYTYTKKMKNKSIIPFIIQLFIGFLYIVPPNIRAQNNMMQFQQFGQEDGISKSIVNTILQDSAGYLWIGSMGGLFRYNGYEFKKAAFLSGEGEQFSNIDSRVLFEDKKYQLWLGTSAGLFQFDKEKEKFFQFNSDSSGALPGNAYIGALCETSYNGTRYLWIGTNSRGLYRYNFSQQKLTFFPLEEPQINDSTRTVMHLFSNEKDVLWITTRDGSIYKFTHKNNRIQKYVHFGQKKQKPVIVLTISQYDEAHLLFGTYGAGLYLFHQKRETFKPLVYQKSAGNARGNIINSVIRDQRGRLWVGTLGDGLYIIDPSIKNRNHILNLKAAPGDLSSLSHNSIWQIYLDKMNNIWIGTTLGLNKLINTKNAITHYTYENGETSGLPHASVESIFEDKNKNLWIGTENGLAIQNAGQEKFSHFFHDPDDPGSLSYNYINYITKDSYDQIWLSTMGKGVNKVVKFDGTNKIKFEKYQHKKEDPFSLSSNFANIIFEDSSKNLWIGTLDGLNRYNRGQDNFTRIVHDKNDPQSIPSNRILQMQQLSTHQYLIGSYQDGLILMDNQEHSNPCFTQYRHDPKENTSLSNDVISDILIDQDIWIATLDGLNKMHIGSGTFKRYTVDHGLPSNMIWSLIRDNFGNLWIGTNAGLSKFNDRSQQHNKFVNFSKSDGLQDNEFNMRAKYKTHNGELIFGGINGVNLFMPNELQRNNYQPSIVFTKFYKFNKPFAFSKTLNSLEKIQLAYEENSFSFEFSALDFTEPAKNKYAYKLAGFLDEWVENGARRRATFTNLDPGHYTFEVKGTNSDGIWNENSAKIAIEITPPYWQTWWFRSFVFILVAGIFYFFYRFRLGKLLAIERLRVKIASDLHDDIGSTLTKISLYSDLILTNTSPEQHKTLLQDISAKSRELVTTMSDVVWSIDARNDTVENMLDHMRDFAMSTCHAQSMEARFEVTGLENDKKLASQIRQNLYLILKEAIHNAAQTCIGHSAKSKAGKWAGRIFYAH